MDNFNKSLPQTNTSGVSTAGLLLVLFIALKLTGVIAWSWWWVLAPLWLPFALFFAVCVVVVLVLFLFSLVKKVLSISTKKR